MKPFLLPILLFISNFAISQDEASTILIYNGKKYNIEKTQQPYTARPDTMFAAVYEFSPDTVMMTFECNAGVTNPTLLDSIFSAIGSIDTFFHPDTDFGKSLSNSKKLGAALKEYLLPFYYVYGTKGYIKCKVGNALYYSGSCICFYGVTLEGYDKNKCGNAIFSYPSLLPITYTEDYKKLQEVLSVQKNLALEDSTYYHYLDKIPPKVFANIGSRYFAYSDTFGVGKCSFPERMVYDLSNDGKHIDVIWDYTLDLFGVPCD